MHNAPMLDDAQPRPIAAVGADYPPSHELDWHRHRRGQLLYAAKGVVAVHTPHGLVTPVIRDVTSLPSNVTPPLAA